MRQIVVVSGRSGSGKSTALQIFEDLGYYCIDNLPVTLILDVVQKLDDSSYVELLALGVDARSLEIENCDFGLLIEQIRPFARTEVVCLDARDDVLLARFSETKHQHPLMKRSGSLPEALELERHLLSEVFRRATYTIDTSDLNIHQLHELLVLKMGASEQMLVIVQSFGFKRGLPLDADLIFDVRHLPNPHWDPALRAFTGLDAVVQSFFAEQPLVVGAVDDIVQFMQKWTPNYAQSNRPSLVIAIGCTGGKHRSVYVADEVAKQLGEHWNTQLLHRELRRNS